MDALKKIEQLFGVKIEAPEVVETLGDKMRQAQAVLEYWENPADWAKKICRECKQEFAYRWDSHAISYCSVSCMAKSLEKIGLKWNPMKPPSERWGRTIPAVVPPEVLELIQETASTQEDQLQDTTVG